jgi:hypothetical protein
MEHESVERNVQLYWVWTPQGNGSHLDTTSQRSSHLLSSFRKLYNK